MNLARLGPWTHIQQIWNSHLTSNQYPMCPLTTKVITHVYPLKIYPTIIINKENLRKKIGYWWCNTKKEHHKDNKGVKTIIRLRKYSSWGSILWWACEETTAIAVISLLALLRVYDGAHSTVLADWPGINIYLMSFLLRWTALQRIRLYYSVQNQVYQAESQNPKHRSVLSRTWHCYFYLSLPRTSPTSTFIQANT